MIQELTESELQAIQNLKEINSETLEEWDQ